MRYSPLPPLRSPEDYAALAALVPTRCPTMRHRNSWAGPGTDCIKANSFLQVHPRGTPRYLACCFSLHGAYTVNRFIKVR